MSDDDKIEKAIGKGARAEALLRSDVFNEAFDKLEADYIAFWKLTDPLDTAGREKIWIAVNQIGKVRQHVASVATNGKLARRELEDKATHSQRQAAE